MNKYTALVLFILANFVAYIVNAVSAITAVIALDAIATISGFVVLQCVGLFFPPLGVVMGWITIFS